MDLERVMDYPVNTEYYEVLNNLKTRNSKFQQFIDKSKMRITKTLYF